MIRRISFSTLYSSYHLCLLILVSMISFSFINYNIQHQSTNNIITIQVHNLIIFNLLFAMLIYCIVKTVRSDAGRVPLVWNFSLVDTKKYCIPCHNFKVRHKNQIYIYNSPNAPTIALYAVVVC